VGRIVFNCLLILGLVFSLAPARTVTVHEVSERSTDPETPLEREEAQARSAVSRSAPKVAGKHRRAILPGSFTIITAAVQSVSPHALSLVRSSSSPPDLHQRHGVLRI
jgi:hypothetical protein